MEAKEKRALVIGYGVPGRAAADRMARNGFAVTVVELNPLTVERCEKKNVTLIRGDGADPDVLEEAGAKHVLACVVAIPVDNAAIEATRQFRRLNAKALLITRCHYLSNGMEAKRAGADRVLVDEQVVAEQLVKELDECC